MKILTFDTCFSKSYIILADDDKILADKVIESTQSTYHSAFLIPTIRDILKNNSLRMKDIDVIGINVGPGSFTGVRVGTTIARVFAQQYDIKAVGIDSLSILHQINDTPKKSIIALDARKNKVYFSQNMGEIKLIEKEELLKYNCSDNIYITDKSIHDYLFDNKIDSVIYEDNDDNLGMYLYKLVKEELNNKNNNFNWANLKPLYIQSPSITMPKVSK